MIKLDCFKAYDVRGKIGRNFNAQICYRISRAFARILNAKKVVIGYDARSTSFDIAESVIEGLRDEGVDVFELGLCGTEEVYWATTHFNACGGIEVTASHNPINYNGLKFVKAQSKPLDPTKELPAIKHLAEKNKFGRKKKLGIRRDLSEVARESYIEKILTFVNPSLFRDYKIVVNSGNGAAGPTFDRLRNKLSDLSCPLIFEHMFSEPDGNFPNGIPNPMNSENQIPTRVKVLEFGANLGVAFDGDFDRCFICDEEGNFIEGEYIVALLSEIFLRGEAGATIVHDPRIIWAIQEVVRKNGGNFVQSMTGHAFFKEKIRKSNAIYGGEMSAHHYFRDFCFCDSGMIPWLKIVEFMSVKNLPLSEIIKGIRASFPSSGEINFAVRDSTAAMVRISDHFGKAALCKDNSDGLILTFKDWRLSIRQSQTEPLMRLNIESRGNRELIGKKLKEINALIRDL